MRRLPNILSFIIIVVSGIIIIVGGYWLIYPYKVIDIHEVKVLNNPVRPGEELQIFLDTTKHLPLTAKILGSIENDHAYPMADQYSNVPMGKADWVLRVKMPESIPEGEYRFHRTYIYRVNPLRDIIVEWSVPFNVLRGSHAKQR
jgi:hypothetical protein